MSEQRRSSQDYNVIEANDESYTEEDKLQDSLITGSSSRAKAEAQTHKRIRADRIKALIAIGAFVTLVFSSAMLGVGVERFQQMSMYKGRGVVVLALSNTMAALMEETAHSVTFTDPSMSIENVDDGLTDRERAERLTQLQSATRSAFEDAVLHRQRFCSDCDSILSVFNYADLLMVQQNVLMRVMSPEEVYAYYSDGLQRLTKIMASFVGWGVEGGVASTVWTEQLLFAVRGLTIAGVSWQDAYRTQSFTEADSYTYMALASQCLRLVHSFSPITLDEPPTTDSVSEGQLEFEQAVTPFAAAMESVLAGVSGNAAGMSSDGEKTAPETIVLALGLYQAILSAVTAESPWNRITFDEWTWVIGLSVALLVLSAFVTLSSLREATMLVWAADEELAQMKETHRLETSFARMQRLVSAMLNLDPAGITDAAKESALSAATSTNAERELMQLANPARYVLSFVSPCVLDRRTTACNTQPAAVGPAGSACEAPKTSDSIAMGLDLQYVSLAMVDLRYFANTDITVETYRTLPKELLVFLNDISALAARCGGTILCISGTVLTIGWNVRLRGGGTTTPENDACTMLSRFRLTNLQHRYPKVRLAVVSGVCTQGVVGSSTLRSYVASGSLVMLGRVLLEGARFHGVRCVTDTTTFLKLDTLQLRKRAIEVLGLYAESEERKDSAPTTGPGSRSSDPQTTGTDNSTVSLGNKTVVYEVTIAGAESNEYSLLWNAAFDDFFTGRVDGAMRKLAAWRQMFGDQPTIRRTTRVLNEVGGYKGPAFYRPSGMTGFDYEFII